MKLEINKYIENINGRELIKQYETILDLEEENIQMKKLQMKKVQIIKIIMN